MRIDSGSISKLSNARFLSLIAELSPERRAQAVLARGAGDPAFFARYFLPHYCRLPFAPFHRRLFDWHLAMGGPTAAREGRRHALAAPRGHAKSTMVSLVLLLHDIVHRREEFVVLISATERQAQQRLRALRAELESGALAAAAPLEASSRRELLANGVRVEAYGAGCELRGISQRAWRPSKIVLDDAEDSACATSPRRREALVEWFGEVVEHLGDRFTNLLAIGTVLHERGLLATLLRRTDFTALRLRAVESFSSEKAHWARWRDLLLDRSSESPREDARAYFQLHAAAMLEGAGVLWPEKWSYEELMAALHLQGRRAFYQELQNSPLGPEDALFDAEAALRGAWDGASLRLFRAAGGREVESRRAAGGGVLRFGHLDLALGKGRERGRGDFSALAVVARLADGTLFAESLWARRAPPSEQVARLFAQHDAQPFTRLAVEGTGFQELLLLPIEEERARRRRARLRADLPIELVKPTARKESRIAALEPLLANGALALAPDLDEEFWEELAQFPRSRHDDALDALAGAVELARCAEAPRIADALTQGRRASPRF
ncbi:MAG: hypothetical protein SF028_09670 [Candidatus Sumerlaeia bacterium]|nr:hypothetical protein [Candidatus Sumerlaeia bacterium]